MAGFRDIKAPQIAPRSQARISQRGMIPTAVKERQFFSGRLYSKTAVFTFTDLLTLSNGEDENVTFTFSHSEEFDLLTPEIYVARYIGSVAAANQLPGGSSVTESAWIWTAPEFDYGAWDGSRYVSAVTLYVRNVSAGASQTVSFLVQGKFIAASPNL